MRLPPLLIKFALLPSGFLPKDIPLKIEYKNDTDFLEKEKSMDINQENAMENEKNKKAEQKEKEKSSYSTIVWLVAVLLLLLILLTTALVFCILRGFTLQDEETPRIEIDIEINAGLPSGWSSPWDTSTPPVGTTTDTTPTETTTDESTPPATTTDDTSPTETTTENTTSAEPLETTETTISVNTDRVVKPNVDLVDQNGFWTNDTTVEIFRATYEGESGTYSARSAYGDNIIAPGTANKYYFDIKNTGNIGVDYTVKVFAEITSSVNGESFLVPLEVRFYLKGGDYMIGSEDDYASMYDIDGLEQIGELGTNRYVRYVLDWQWPFEGNDELDTMLGNFAADGAEIRVALRLQVTASMNGAARGGTIIGK